MKVYILLLMSLFGMSALLAQDTTKTTCHSKKTFVIRKKKEATIPQANTAASSAAPASETVETKNEKKTKTDGPLSQTNSKTFVKVRKSADGEATVAKLPTLAGGDFGLMDIQPYHPKLDLKDWKYVILQYSVSQYGWATQVEVLKTNDALLEATVLRKLKKTKWNPAINLEGKPVDYRMYQQVVIVKDRTYEEDYNKD